MPVIQEWNIFFQRIIFFQAATMLLGHKYWSCLNTTITLKNGTIRYCFFFFFTATLDQNNINGTVKGESLKNSALNSHQVL